MSLGFTWEQSGPLLAGPVSGVRTGRPSAVPPVSVRLWDHVPCPCPFALSKHL